MDSKSITETIEEREIRAFVAGFAAETLELRGYPLTEEETAEITAEAREIYAEPVAPVVAA